MVAKTNDELQALEQPKSRSEEFLNYICGRAIDINSLPIPQSRIEEYLEYLCHNGGVGGGGSGGSPITIDQVDGLRAELDSKGDNLSLEEDKLVLQNGDTELSSIPITTTAEIELILQNLQ